MASGKGVIDILRDDKWAAEQPPAGGSDVSDGQRTRCTECLLQGNAPFERMGQFEIAIIGDNALIVGWRSGRSRELIDRTRKRKAQPRVALLGSEAKIRKS